MATPLRVLLLEDSEDDALLNVRELKGAGYAPDWARVETAEEMAAALAERWDVILADHNMPRFDAISALDLLKARGSDVPCIIVSGSIGEQQLLDAMQHGAEDYVLKRDLARLGSAVPRALDVAKERRERRRAETLLRESEERYALALRGARDGIWDYNLVTGELYCSDRLKEIFGTDETTSLRAAFSDLVHEEDRELVRRAMQAHLERHEPLEIEYRVRTISGEHRWIFVRGQALWAEDGRPLRLAGSVSDITARKCDEEMLRQKIAIIEAQEEAIRTLSTPVIEVWDGVLMMPIYGSIDASRAAQMMEVLLTAVAERRCRNAIIDLTSVKGIDANSADHILRIVRAVQIIGAHAIAVGIRPEIAQVMAEIGVDLEDITTLATVRDALVLCMKDQRARR